jgi:serine/threonine protein phosphatase PrpC
LAATEASAPGVEERTGPLSGAALRAAARTHRGTVRQDNQDAFLCRPDLGLFAAIDGMGGQRAGRRAAELAREAVLEEGDPARGLAAANERIRQAASTNPELQGMGCVATALLVKDGVARIAHIGDTRVYLAGSAGCEQLTRDHTVAATEQERLGLSHQTARDLPGRNQVTRDLGARARRGQGWIDRLEVPLEKGSLLLLCSDGLPAAVGGAALFERLRLAQRAGTAPEDLADELVAAALERGAPDNVTAVVVRQETDVPAPRGDDTTPGASPALATARRALLPLLLGFALGFVARGCVGP